MLMCAPLEDGAVLKNLNAILSVPDIDLHSIGPNDFAQRLGNPGQPDHPEAIKTMQEIIRHIQQAGRTLQREAMHGAWVSEMLSLRGVALYRHSMDKRRPFHAISAPCPSLLPARRRTPVSSQRLSSGPSA
jgi:2-keto-3-deoxy-L-rhamnonate aldolase RhmA